MVIRYRHCQKSVFDAPLRIQTDLGQVKESLPPSAAVFDFPASNASMTRLSQGLGSRVSLANASMAPSISSRHQFTLPTIKIGVGSFKEALGGKHGGGGGSVAGSLRSFSNHSQVQLPTSTSRDSSIYRNSSPGQASYSPVLNLLQKHQKRQPHQNVSSFLNSIEPGPAPAQSLEGLGEKARPVASSEADARTDLPLI